MTMTAEYTKEQIEEEFPGWEVWPGMLESWLARLKGATPPVMVWGEDLTDLRDQIKVRIAKARALWEKAASGTPPSSESLPQQQLYSLLLCSTTLDRNSIA